MDIYGNCHGGRDLCPFKSTIKKVFFLYSFHQTPTKYQYSFLLQDCRVDLVSNYKFYLAFENSMCRDYVTEKYHQYLRQGIVPIVMGRVTVNLVLLAWHAALSIVIV